MRLLTGRVAQDITRVETPTRHRHTSSVANIVLHIDLPTIAAVDIVINANLSVTIAQQGNGRRKKTVDKTKREAIEI